MSEKVEGSSKSGWCLTKDHDGCKFRGCACECHKEQS